MRFFFYGTLIAGHGNAAARAVHERLRPLGEATARGRLFAVPDAQGWYPALLPGVGEVQGQLYEGALNAAELRVMDAYEGWNARRPAQSLYRRTQIRLSGRLRAQAYIFARSLPPGAMQIGDGDFARWIARTGHRAFGE